MSVKVRTQIPPYLQTFKKIPKEKVCRPHLPSPRTLLEIAGDKVNQLPLPQCWDWTVARVAKWVVLDLNFPQYRQCFLKNLINGRTLILVDASALQKMNITKFEHITVICKAIRDLYHIEAEYFKRSISLPLRYPETLFLLHKFRTGEKIAKMTRTEFFLMAGIIQPPTRKVDHWTFIEPYQERPRIAVGRWDRPICISCGRGATTDISRTDFSISNKMNIDRPRGGTMRLVSLDCGLRMRQELEDG